MNYDTDRWILINYPPGGGGKFVATCLMLFDNIAHWASKPRTPIETVNWYKTSLPKKEGVWSEKEIDTPWILPASRLWSRGETLSKSEFWDEFNKQVTPWFQQCHDANKFIIDFWHKQQKPLWWSYATWINLVVDDIELYKNLLFSKVFKYDKAKKIITRLDQIPNVGRPTTRFYKSVFQNHWQWFDVEDKDDFYSNIVTKMDGFDWDFSIRDTENQILLSDLFDIDKLEEFLLKFEGMFNSRLDRKALRDLHQNWLNITIQQLSK